MKYWNDGSASSSDIAGVANYTNNVGSGFGANNNDMYYGDTNSNAIGGVVPPTAGGYHAAARYCLRLSYGGYTDWYLPNRYELNLMYTNRASLPGLQTGGQGYWSSSEADANSAWTVYMNDGYQTYNAKNVSLLVRCVRRY